MYFPDIKNGPLVFHPPSVCVFVEYCGGEIACEIYLLSYVNSFQHFPIAYTSMLQLLILPGYGTDIVHTGMAYPC